LYGGTDQAPKLPAETIVSPCFISIIDIGAGEGNRTLVCSLGSCRSTIELRPRMRSLRPL
jgi:hypothetical protein